MGLGFRDPRFWVGNVRGISGGSWPDLNHQGFESLELRGATVRTQTVGSLVTTQIAGMGPGDARQL